MKLKYILGILVLILSIGTASANQANLVANNGATFELVKVTYDEQTHTSANPGEIIFDVSKSADPAFTDIPDPWFKYVGLVVIPSVTITSATDNNPTTPGWHHVGPINILSVYYDCWGLNAESEPSHHGTQVILHYTGTISGTPQFGAHVAWGEKYPTENDEDSAKFTNGGSTPSTPIPEFPTIALPVAGILGLMLILGRRNKE